MSGGLCPGGHRLQRAEVPSSWMCDACRTYYPKGALSCGCRTCDIDTCDRCAARLCPKQHVLILATPAEKWECDGCHAESSAPSCGCRVCNYDLCLFCAYTAHGNTSPPTHTSTNAVLGYHHHHQDPLPLVPTAGPPVIRPPPPAVPQGVAPGRPPTPSATASGGSSATCPAGHALLEAPVPAPWVCDGCRSTFPKNTSALSCRRCDIDVCLSCAKGATCPARHVLLKRPTGGNWVCDRCHQSFPGSMHSNGCRRCDYDVCPQCRYSSPNGRPPPLQQQQQASPYQPVPQPSPVVVTPPPAPDRVRALFIGINYKGTKSQLSGCVNDVHTMVRLVKAHGLPITPGNARALVDDAEHTFRDVLPVIGRPDKRTIMEQLRWLSAGARPGDTLLLHYSGHGTQLRDQDGDEADGLDEALVPLDFQHHGCIRDDDVFAFVCRDLPAGVRVTCIADCCHAGSIMDLEYEWRWGGERFADVPSRQEQRRRSSGTKDFALASRRKTKADVVLFSGCKDTQTSSDVGNTLTFKHEFHGPGRAGGACTNALAEVLQQAPVQQQQQQQQTLSIGLVLEAMLNNLKRRKFQQVPQLSSSKKLNMHAPFRFYGPLD